MWHTNVFEMKKNLQKIYQNTNRMRMGSTEKKVLVTSAAHWRDIDQVMDALRFEEDILINLLKSKMSVYVTNLVPPKTIGFLLSTHDLSVDFPKLDLNKNDEKAGTSESKTFKNKLDYNTFIKLEFLKTQSKNTVYAYPHRTSLQGLPIDQIGGFYSYAPGTNIFTTSNQELYSRDEIDLLY
jgi:hypothetical protein